MRCLLSKSLTDDKMHHCVSTGGMGKTTIADQIYREMATLPQFTFAKHMTFEMGSKDVDPTKLVDFHDWMKNSRGPVLVYLDNVQRKKQLQSLLTECVVPHGSFILMTSRIQGLVEHCEEFKMPIMKHKDALTLFRWHSRGGNRECTSLRKELQVTSVL
jgi:late competence protein required for DNA uptake (superfamily II DNA/RNA helicase)